VINKHKTNVKIPYCGNYTDRQKKEEIKYFKRDHVILMYFDTLSTNLKIVQVRYMGKTRQF